MEKAALNKHPMVRLRTMSPRDLWRQLWILPNLLSITRILCLPIVVLLIIRGYDIASVIAMTIIWITDYVDGYIARKFNLKTELGLLLDPLADKITSAVVFLTLYLFRGFPLWVVLLIVGRDIIILSAGYYLLKRGKLARSNEIGRKTTVLLCIIILLYLLRIERWANLLCYLLILFVAATLVSYGWRFYKAGRKFPTNNL